MQIYTLNIHHSTEFFLSPNFYSDINILKLNFPKVVKVFCLFFIRLNIDEVYQNYGNFL